ncbi:uncharacterized protein LOC111262432 isoform X2 [Varroa jacobsoni]|nr:uncharacterized protein LOC111262432 isoform X2 [Varroa jacobsoni]
MVTACALMYHAIAENSPEVRPDHLAKGGSHAMREACNMVSAMFTIIMLVGYTANLTAIVAHKFLASVMPGVLNSVSRNRRLSLLLSTISTTQVAVLCVSLIQPWSSNSHTRICLPPYQWGETFSRMVAGTYCAQMLICALLLFELTMNSKREGDGKTVASLDVQVLWLKYILLALSTVPFAALTIYHSMAMQRNLCFVVKDSIQVWTLVSTVLLASALPAVHVLSDQVICRGTLYLLQRLLCLSRNEHALDGALIPPVLPDEPYLGIGHGSRECSRRLDLLPNREQFILCISGQTADSRSPVSQVSATGSQSHYDAQHQIHQQQADVMY